jgi:hypothetical protein
MQTCVTNLHHHVSKDVWEQKYNLMIDYNSINIKRPNDWHTIYQYYKMHPIPRTSVYTRFWVLLPLPSTSLLGLHKTQVDPWDTPLDKATNNCPCENTGSSRYTPTVGRAWPCALLIVIMKLRHTGNYFLLNLKGNDRSSDGDNGILGMKTLSPACVRTKTWWLAWNKVRPCLVRLNRLLFSSKQQRQVKQLSKAKKTSKCEKEKCLIDWLLAALWRKQLSLIYTTWLLSLYNSLNRLLFLYNSTCGLYGFYLTIFIYLNS